MARAKSKPYPQPILDLMAQKTAILTKAHALADLGIPEAAAAVWATAASYEERLAPLLEALGREAEAALYRVSAASCYQKAGEFSRAANLYRAALAGTLRKDTQEEVHRMLAGCLAELTAATVGSAG